MSNLGKNTEYVQKMFAACNKGSKMPTTWKKSKNKGGILGVIPPYINANPVMPHYPQPKDRPASKKNKEE